MNAAETASRIEDLTDAIADLRDQQARGQGDAEILADTLACYTAKLARLARRH